MKKAISIVILAAFITTSVKSPAWAQSAQEEMMPSLPAPGVMVHLSPEFTPAQLQGVTIHPDNALQFDFLINKGDSLIDGDQKKVEYKKLVKYFLASLTIPDEDQWVNLSPYEKNRIIKDDFGKTEMGRDLLAEDYMLKQITSSLIYPEDGLGKKFWDIVYKRAWSEYHTTNIPVNTFNKVWIVPDKAIVYESGNTAYIIKSHLKVMLEEDYLSLQKHSANKTHSIGSQVIREIILPELEKEVNEGKNFSNLRQMYSGMVLATWYKKAMKESLLGKVYADQARVKGVDQDPKTNEAIYQRYLKAFKKGVFNYIKEDVDKYTKEAIPRKYFSGGFDRAMEGRSGDVIIIHKGEPLPNGIDMAALSENIDRATVALTTGPDAAMLGASGLRRVFISSVLLPLSIIMGVSSGVLRAGEIGTANFDNGYVTMLVHTQEGDTPESIAKQFLTLFSKIRKDELELMPGMGNFLWNYLLEKGLIDSEGVLQPKVLQVKDFQEFRQIAPMDEFVQKNLYSLFTSKKIGMNPTPETIKRFAKELTGANNFIKIRGGKIVPGQTLDLWSMIRERLFEDQLQAHKTIVVTKETVNGQKVEYYYLRGEDPISYAQTIVQKVIFYVGSFSDVPSKTKSIISQGGYRSRLLQRVYGGKSDLSIIEAELKKAKAHETAHALTRSLIDNGEIKIYSEPVSNDLYFATGELSGLLAEIAGSEDPQVSFTDYAWAYQHSPPYSIQYIYAGEKLRGLMLKELKFEDWYKQWQAKGNHVKQSKISEDSFSGFDKDKIPGIIEDLIKAGYVDENKNIIPNPSLWFPDNFKLDGYSIVEQGQIYRSLIIASDPSVLEDFSLDISSQEMREAARRIHSNIFHVVLPEYKDSVLPKPVLEEIRTLTQPQGNQNTQINLPLVPGTERMLAAKDAAMMSFMRQPDGKFLIVQDKDVQKAQDLTEKLMALTSLANNSGSLNLEARETLVSLSRWARALNDPRYKMDMQLTKEAQDIIEKLDLEHSPVLRAMISRSINYFGLKIEDFSFRLLPFELINENDLKNYMVINVIWQGSTRPKDAKPERILINENKVDVRQWLKLFWQESKNNYEIAVQRKNALGNILHHSGSYEEALRQDSKNGAYLSPLILKARELRLKMASLRALCAVQANGNDDENFHNFNAKIWEIGPDISTIRNDTAMTGQIQELYGDLIGKISSNIGSWRPKNYPPGVDQHLNSHQAQLKEMEVQGFLSKFDAEFESIFAEGHDMGYAADFTDQKFMGKAEEIWRKIGLIVGYSPTRSDEIAKQIRDMMRLYSNFPELVKVKLEQVNKNPKYDHLKPEDKQKIATALAGMESYMVTRVIAHGTTSIVFVMDKLINAGFDENKALGIALIFAAHHPGYPISMVNQFVIPGVIPSEYAPVLLITGLPGTGIVNTDESLRQKLADRAANLLNIPLSEARYYATLGFALDRITPARMMTTFERDTFDLKSDGSYKGQIIWGGPGETIKKYPLIVTNIKDPKQFTVSDVFRLAIINLKKEAEAAVKAAELMNDGITAPNDEMALRLRNLINQRSTFEINQTEKMHEQILTMLREKLPEFSGDLKDIDTLIHQALDLFPQIPRGDKYRASIEYLLGFLITIKTSALAQNHIKSITGAVKKETGVDRIINDIFTESQLGSYFDASDLTAFIQAPGVSLVEKIKGEIILKQGDQGQDMYVIQSGDVNIFIDNVFVATRHAGEILGEIGALTGGPRTATNVAASDKVVLVHIPASESRKLIIKNPRPFSDMMSKRLSTRDIKTDSGVAYRFTRGIDGKQFVSKGNGQDLLDRINAQVALAQIDAIEPNLNIVEMTKDGVPVQLVHDNLKGANVLKISRPALTSPDKNSVSFLLDLMKYVHLQGIDSKESESNQAVGLIKGYLEFLKDYIKDHPKDRTLSQFNLALGGLIEHYRKSSEDQIVLSSLEFLYNFNSQLRYFVDDDQRLESNMVDLSKNLFLLFNNVREFPIGQVEGLETKMDYLFAQESRRSGFIYKFKNMDLPDTGFYAKRTFDMNKNAYDYLISQLSSIAKVTPYFTSLQGEGRVRVSQIDLEPLSGHENASVSLDIGTILRTIGQLIQSPMVQDNKNGSFTILPDKALTVIAPLPVQERRGGIDFNSANLNLQIKRDGRGVPLPLSRQDMAQLSHIQGFEVNIIQIKPAANLPILSEIQKAIARTSI